MYVQVKRFLYNYQQDEVLAELREYARGQPLPDDSASVELVIAYLSSLNNLFERSILGRSVRVFDPHGSTMQRMESGYQFFVQWACKQYPNGDQVKFLSWQASIHIYTCMCTRTLSPSFTHTCIHTHALTLIHACTHTLVRVNSSYMALIGVHEMHGRVHPN